MFYELEEIVEGKMGGMFGGIFGIFFVVFCFVLEKNIELFVFKDFVVFWGLLFKFVFESLCCYILV